MTWVNLNHSTRPPSRPNRHHRPSTHSQWPPKQLRYVQRLVGVETWEIDAFVYRLQKKPASTTAGKAPASKAPAGKAPAKKAVKKTPAADGEKKKKRKTRKET